MTVVEDKIKINRGNALSLDISIDNSENDYTFQDGDFVTFAIYNRKGLNQEPLVSKKVTCTPNTTTVNIALTTEEMKIGEKINKEKIYWYEITLNNEVVLGYDENGEKELILYPEGADL